MGMSSSVLFHFTNSMDNLVNILTNGFQPRFCLENLGQLFPNLREDIWEQAIPMVCFCDLPLSDVKEHLRIYGNYGLGLTKEWGIRKGINPVIYLCPDSYLCGYIFNILSTFVDDNERHKLIRDFTDISGFVKPHKGVISRNDKVYERCFYDEREWRYVPRLYGTGVYSAVNYRLRKREFMDSSKRANADADIRRQIKLTFKPKDLKYILVGKENERAPMKNKIEGIKGKYDNDTVAILSTRIISSEQVMKDF